MDAAELSALIRRRQTWKVLAPIDQPVVHSLATLQSGDRKVSNAIAVAGWAPFHFDRAVDGIAEPWRVHVLSQSRCRELANEFSDLFSDVKPSNKLPSMLAACGALVLVNWLPQFSFGARLDNDEVAKDKQIQIDEEHLAAASAFVQNLLLVLTVDALGTYWSSGGQFRTPAMFEHLNIPPTERLLAAVFVDYSAEDTSLERLDGKLRNRRADSTEWVRWV